MTARDALDAVALDQPDVVLLELGLPDVDGMVVCRELRRWFTNPIVVLSADPSEARLISALDAGGDDYIVKPFSAPELMARIRVALRHRDELAAIMNTDLISVGDVTIDTVGHAVLVGGHPVELGRKEFALLVLLARNPGKVVPHGTILSQVWGISGTESTQALRVMVTQLRHKLGDGDHRPHIVPISGLGYRLMISETAST